MVAVFRSARKPCPGREGLLRRFRRAAAGLVLAGAALGLAACEPISMPGRDGPRVDPRAPVTVALLVPGGSGQSTDEAIAASIENAARMAVADLGDAVQITLRVYNTAGRADQAAQVAAQAVNDGASIILGPVFADAARAAGQAVAGAGVNVLSFSNNPSAAGGNVFILGQTFENTANRLAAHAVREGKGRILAVHERNEAGEVGRRAIEQAVMRAGGSFAGAQGFDFSQQGVVDAVPQISTAARSGGADALFFTSNAVGALPLLTQLLPENRTGPAQFQYIGLTRWDIPRSTLALNGVQGAWFALPDPDMTRQFEARYSAAYGGDPVAIAGLGYDGIAAIGALLRSGGRDALSRSSLTQASGFAGVSGVFRLRPDGMNERGLAIAQIVDQQVRVIDPAPRSFAGPGF